MSDERALMPCPFCGGEVMRRDALWPSEGDRDAVIHAGPSDCPLQVFQDDTWGGSLYGRWNAGLDAFAAQTLAREVERRREAEADIDAMLVCVVRYCIGRMSYIVGTCDGWLRKRWPSLSAGTRDVILKDIHAALEQERLGRRNLGMQIDIDTWAALYRDMSPGGALAAVAPVDRQGGSPDAS